MKTISLRQRLLRYLQNHHTEWFASKSLQELVIEHTKHAPRTAVRQLQLLAEDKEIEVEYRHGHAFYRAKSAAQVAEPPQGEFIQGVGWVKSYAEA